MFEHITIDESYEMASMTLRQGNFGNANSTVARIYVVRGASDETEACAAAYEKAPDKIPDMEGRDRIPKLQAQVHEKCGDSIWKIAVEYGYTTGSSPTSDEDDQEENDVPEVSFQCSGSTIHITQAIDQVCRYSRPGLPEISHEDAKKIPIGWNGKRGPESEAAGVDVPCAELHEIYVKHMRFSVVRSIAWRRKVAKCYRKINVGKFKGWEPGEVMFMGCSYTTPLRGVDKVKVTFDFLIRQNEDNVKVCGHDIGDIYGQDYVWAITSDKKNGNAISKVVDYIFDSRVVPVADFNILGV